MAVSNHKPVWNVIDEFGLNINCDSISDKLKCVICKKLLMDATLSTVCGCRYCYKCVNSYINNEDKYCPGGSENCNDSFIVMDRDIVRSQNLNKKISKVKVECPNQSCNSNVELVEIPNHLRCCSKQPINCPYVPIGCNMVEVVKETIECHLDSDTFTHSKLLIELIQKLMNKVKVLEEDSFISKSEIVDLKEELRIHKDQILMLNEELRVKNNDMTLRIETNDNKQRQIVEATRENLTKMIDDLKDDFGKSKLEITSLREVIRKNEDIIVMLEKEMNECRARSKDASIDRENLTAMMNNVNEINEKFNKCDRWRDGGINELCPNIDRKFEWRIEGFSNKIRNALYSDPFFANYYKLCLYAMICDDYRDCIWLRCYIMKGDNDDKLQWPMRQTVTLSIVNQVTLLGHKSETYKYDTFKGKKEAFNRPNEHRNHWAIGLYESYYSIGFYRLFIKYSSIRNNPSIFVNNSMVLRCTVTHE